MTTISRSSLSGFAAAAVAILLLAVPANAQTPPVAVPAEVPANPKLFGEFTGDYLLPNGARLTISREGDRLFGFIAASGFEKAELFASGERAFFARTTSTQITFAAAVDGKAPEVNFVTSRHAVIGKRAG